MFHFCTVTDVEADKEVLRLSTPAIYQCYDKSDSAGRDGMRSYDYVLEIHYFPMNWFDLLNAFEFTALIYIFIFTLVGAGTSFAGFIFWGMHRLLTRMKHPPPFRFMAMLKLVAPPL